MNTNTETIEEEPTSNKKDNSDVAGTAKEVLRRKMMFYDTIARELLADIIIELKEQNKRPDLLALMYKKLSEADTVAIDCAHKLAPYQHPKLQTIEQKGGITHRFVVRAPIAANSSDDWLSKIPPPKPLELMSSIIDINEEDNSED